MNSVSSPQGHYARLRQRFLTAGLDGFLNYEVIELLLKLADNRRDQKIKAKELLHQFKSLRGVLEASPAQLKKVKGVGDANIFGLKLVQEVARRYLKDQVIGEEVIQSSEAVIDYLKHNLRDRNREVFMVILLNGKNRIIDLVELFEGTLTTSAVYPREVIKLVLERDAAAVIFVHNHPSGNPNPSHDDHTITKKLKAACATIDVQVHDHIIIADNKTTSFADKGMV
ncbi:MAG: DNA repair protein RadC [Candidatus Marinimicrobia bacterium]|nr:DNA repair protein RadC [Candidatus Neomarinimicrobiota bacterium]MDP6852792.1 DNA repair protein RadC [Candidatus Neomarinimicrobiota bacterium]MDP6936414.1 DNA repair protein RadC [Candidatus Neomarinimicrobiota bacterium]